MKWRKWEELPENMQTEEVWEYYQILACKKGSLLLKRAFDFIFAGILLVLFSPVMFVVSVLITLDSPGGIFFRQERVTTYGKIFQIHKFRTMTEDAEKAGTQITVDGDRRITRVGKLLRGCRLDELPQLLDVLSGNMSFVGTRPEVTKYVDQYTAEMRATLLLPAGITSQASIWYKDEAKLLAGADNVDAVYVEKILPEKMRYNLQNIREFSLCGDIKIMLDTVLAVMGKELVPGKAERR